MAVVNDHSHKIKSKLRNKGIPVILVGYPTHHSSDVFQFFNKETKRIILSRDAIWLNQNYSDYHGLNTFHIVDTTDGRAHTFDDEQDADEYDIVELDN